MRYLLFIFLFGMNWQVILSQEFEIKETTFKNGELTLVADIYSPNKPKKEKIGIALIQGSGHSGRSNVWSFLMAEFLSENGYYVLLPDKRGVGKSQGDWKKASLLDLADDAIHSARHLKKLHSLDQVGVMGLSEGGTIVPAVATQSEVDFVINMVGGALPPERKIIHEVTHTAMEEGLSPEEINGVLELHALYDDYIYSENKDWTVLEKKFENIKQSSWSEFGATFPNTPDSWVFDWVKRNFKFDPMEYWVQVKQDVFIAYGANDHNVPTYECAYQLHRGFHKAKKTNYELHIYPAGHSLFESGTTFRQDFRNDLLKWLDKR